MDLVLRVLDEWNNKVWQHPPYSDEFYIQIHGTRGIYFTSDKRGPSYLGIVPSAYVEEYYQELAEKLDAEFRELKEYLNARNNVK